MRRHTSSQSSRGALLRIGYSVADCHQQQRASFFVNPGGSDNTDGGGTSARSAGGSSRSQHRDFSNRNAQSSLHGNSDNRNGASDQHHRRSGHSSPRGNSSRDRPPAAAVGGNNSRRFASGDGWTVEDRQKTDAMAMFASAGGDGDGAADPWGAPVATSTTPAWGSSAKAASVPDAHTAGAGAAQGHQRRDRGAHTSANAAGSNHNESNASVADRNPQRAPSDNGHGRHSRSDERGGSDRRDGGHRTNNTSSQHNRGDNRRVGTSRQHGGGGGGGGGYNAKDFFKSVGNGWHLTERKGGGGIDWESWGVSSSSPSSSSGGADAVDAWGSPIVSSGMQGGPPPPAWGPTTAAAPSPSAAPFGQGLLHGLIGGTPLPQHSASRTSQNQNFNAGQASEAGGNGRPFGARSRPSSMGPATVNSNGSGGNGTARRGDSLPQRLQSASAVYHHSGSDGAFGSAPRWRSSNANRDDGDVASTNDAAMAGNSSSPAPHHQGVGQAKSPQSAVVLDVFEQAFADVAAWGRGEKAPLGLSINTNAAASGGYGGASWDRKAVGAAADIPLPAPRQLGRRAKPSVILTSPAACAESGSDGTAAPLPLPFATPLQGLEMLKAQRQRRIERYFPPTSSAGRGGSAAMGLEEAVKASPTQWLVAHSKAQSSQTLTQTQQKSTASNANSADEAPLVDPSDVAAALVREGMPKEAAAVLMEALRETTALATEAGTGHSGSAGAAADPSSKSSVVSKYIVITKPFAGAGAGEETSGDGDGVGATTSPTDANVSSPIFSPLKTSSTHIELSFPTTAPSAAQSSSLNQPTTTSTTPPTDASPRPSYSVPFSRQMPSNSSLALSPRGGGPLAGANTTSAANALSQHSARHQPQGGSTLRNNDAMRFAADLIPIYCQMGQWERALELVSTDMMVLPASTTEVLITCVVGAQRSAEAWAGLAEGLFKGHIKPFMDTVRALRAQQQDATTAQSQRQRQAPAKEAKKGTSAGTAVTVPYSVYSQRTGITVEGCRTLLYTSSSTSEGGSASSSAFSSSSIDRVSSALAVWNAFAKRTGQSNVAMVLDVSEGLLMRDEDLTIAANFLSPLIFETLGLPIPPATPTSAADHHTALSPSDGIRYAVLNGLCRIFEAEQKQRALLDDTTTTTSVSSQTSAGGHHDHQHHPGLAAALDAVLDACDLCIEMWAPFVPSLSHAERARNGGAPARTGKVSSGDNTTASAVSSPPIPSMEKFLQNASCPTRNVPSFVAPPTATGGPTTAAATAASKSSYRQHNATFDEDEEDDAFDFGGGASVNFLTEERLNALLDEGEWEEAFDMLPTIVASRTGVVGGGADAVSFESDINVTKPLDDNAHLLPAVSRVRLGIANHVLAKALSGGGGGGGRPPLPLEALRSLLGFVTKEGLLEPLVDGCVPVLAKEAPQLLNVVVSKGAQKQQQQHQQRWEPVVRHRTEEDDERDADDPTATIYSTALGSAKDDHEYAMVRVRVFTEGQRQALFKSVSKLLQLLTSEGSEAARLESLMLFLAMGAANDALTASHPLFALEEMGRKGTIIPATTSTSPSTTAIGGGGSRTSGDTADFSETLTASVGQLSSSSNPSKNAANAAASMWDALTADANAALFSTPTSNNSSQDSPSQAKTTAARRGGHAAAAPPPPSSSSAATSSVEADAKRAALLHCIACYKSMVAKPLPSSNSSGEVSAVTDFVNGGQASYAEGADTSSDTSTAHPPAPFVSYRAGDYNESFLVRKLLRTLSAHTRPSSVPVMASNLAIGVRSTTAEPNARPSSAGDAAMVRVPSAVDVLAAAFPPPPKYGDGGAAMDKALRGAALSGALQGRDTELIMPGNTTAAGDGDHHHHRIATATPLAKALLGTGRGGLGEHSASSAPNYYDVQHAGFEKRTRIDAVHATARALRLLAWDSEECCGLGLRAGRYLKAVGEGQVLGSVLGLKMPFMPRSARAEAEALLFDDSRRDGGGEREGRIAGTRRY